MKRLTLIAATLIAIVWSATFNNVMATTPATTKDGDVVVDIETTMGNIRLLLYGVTPKHRDNFVKLVKEGAYDGVLFHRVINDFMIQTGDVSTGNSGRADIDETIEAEFRMPELFHRRGAVAAARQGDQVNPERRSSGSQFYIVTGRKFTDEQLNRMEAQGEQQRKMDIFNTLSQQHMDSIRAMYEANNTEGLEALRQELVRQTEAEYAKNPYTFTPEMREAYTTVGGTPHLDGTYTVFGEVLSGMDVVDKIQKVETDPADKPLQDVRIIKMTIVK